MPEHIKPEQVDIWFQDESRIGQQGSLTRVWHEKGKRPRLIRQQQFEYAYIFGAVCLTTGATAALVMPGVNKEAMLLHLQQISKETPEGRHAMVVMDGAGWHQDFHELKNVSILKLPPYSQELNPIERVWRQLKQTSLSNRCYKGYEQIVEAGCIAWNALVAEKDKLCSLVACEWALL